MVNDYKKYFIFNGKKSSDFDVWASGLNIFHSPERRIERIQVPGRNGELLIEDGSFENTELLFKDCFIPRHFGENFTNLSNYLNRQKGYQRLELSWLPDEYRLAAFHGDIEASMKNWDGMGKFDLAFNCKPQRFLKSGEEPVTLIPVKADGTTTFMTPKYMFPTWSYPEVVPSDAYTVAITLLESEYPISYKVRFYMDGDPAYVDTTEETLTTGERVTKFTTSSYAIGWQVIFTKSSSEDIDTPKLRIEGFSAAIADKSRMDGILCRRFSMHNPTGYKCKPLFDVYGQIFTLQGVKQIGDEFWSIQSTDYSSVTSHVIMDCENEYLYYVDANGNKKNVTGYITITHKDNANNTLIPSFPEFGEGETLLTQYTTATTSQTVGMMIVVYPHWFTI